MKKYIRDNNKNALQYEGVASGEVEEFITCGNEHCEVCQDYINNRYVDNISCDYTSDYETFISAMRKFKRIEYRISLD